MTDEHEIGADLTPGDLEIAERLRARRLAPAAGFRAVLARHLSARDPGYGPRPERLLLHVAAYLGAGSVLIALGALLGVGVL
jgi:hypothetical protein